MSAVSLSAISNIRFFKGFLIEIDRCTLREEIFTDVAVFA